LAQAHNFSLLKIAIRNQYIIIFVLYCDLRFRKRSKNKANRHVTPGISLDARLNALLVKKTSGCDSRPFGLAAEEKQQKGALSVAI
jgi:hypothetical protein